MSGRRTEEARGGMSPEAAPRFVTLTRQRRTLTLDLSTLDALTSRQGPLTPTLPHLRSPYELLIHALPWVSPRESRWWSRARATTSERVSPAMWGLMKVAGKRLSTTESRPSSPEGDHEQVSASQLEAWSCALAERALSRAPLLGERFSTLKAAGIQLRAWVEQVNDELTLDGGGERVEPGRRWSGARRVVGALALNRSGEVIGASLNHPSLSVTAHAEWCLLDQLWRGDRWPVDGELTLISSLKPCKLCAGAWVTHAPYTALKVYYLRDDPGPSGQNTAFDLESFAYSEAKRWRNSWGSLSQSKLTLEGAPSLIE